jgi:hypothetical protein
MCDVYMYTNATDKGTVFVEASLNRGNFTKLEKVTRFFQKHVLHHKLQLQKGLKASKRCTARVTRQGRYYTTLYYTILQYCAYLYWIYSGYVSCLHMTLSSSLSA